VPIDLSCQELASVLPTYGYQKEHKSFFIWEAVTQYLPETAVRKTFDFLAQVPVGSRMVFTYIRQDFIDGTALYGLETLYQGFRVKEQWWHFGFVPEQLAAFLQEYSWKELEQVGSQEYTARYLKPCGRSIPVMEIERAVYAEKV
jgi:methyltransferase (TIGR00027 family)